MNEPPGARGKMPRCIRAAMHPGWLRCSAELRFAPRSPHAQYAPSSRRAPGVGAPRRSRCNAGFHHGLLAAIVGAVVAAACAEPAPSNELRVSGHVEATEVRVAAEVGGRLVALTVVEGDRVEAGDIVARIDARDAELEVGRAQAEREASLAQLRLLQAGARPEDVRRAQAQIDALEAETAALEAELAAAVADRERFESLLAADAGSRKQRDDAAARVNVLQQRTRALREQVRAAEQVVARLESGARTEEIDAARARVAAIDAQIAVLRKRIDDATVVAPAGGIVTQALVERGEIVGPAMPLFVVTDIDRAWANLFVPGPAVPRLTIGQAALVFTDAGGAGLPGTVTFVSPQAEFTPRNVQTAEERSMLVYRVKVAVDNREGVLKPGMPVDALLELP